MDSFVAGVRFRFWDDNERSFDGQAFLDSEGDLTVVYDGDFPAQYETRVHERLELELIHIDGQTAMRPIPVPVRRPYDGMCI